MSKAVFFDLDGTIVHSAPGILNTFRWTFARHGIKLANEPDTSVIGPPLRATLRRLTGIVDAVRIEELATTFRERYDSMAVARTESFPGYDATMDALRVAGYELLVATNKRIDPARAIVARLGRPERYLGIYAPDAHDPPLPDKSAVVASAIALHGIDIRRSALVGDSADDATAAAANGLAFIAAAYGYGDPTSGGHPVAATIGSLSELPARLAALAL